MMLYSRARALAGVFVMALWLGGCATPQSQSLLKDRPPQLPPQAELTKVPFYPQETHQCGPASLAMALHAAGAEVAPQALVPKVYLPQRQGSLQPDMLAATRRNGMIAFELAPRLADVLAEVAAGTPVVVLQNLALSWAPVWHYAVLVGYDLERREVFLRSGLERRQVLPLATFERTWARADHWAMLALPPGKIPESAAETAYVSAASAAEQAGQPKAAQSSYVAALQRWPKSLGAQIGLGNTAYVLGDKARALKAFRQATLDHPDSAAAYNNLAQTLADQHRYREAHAAATRAVALGGPLLAASRETLEQIGRRMGK